MAQTHRRLFGSGHRTTLGHTKPTLRTMLGITASSWGGGGAEITACCGAWAFVPAPRPLPTDMGRIGTFPSCACSRTTSCCVVIVRGRVKRKMRRLSRRRRSSVASIRIEVLMDNSVARQLHYKRGAGKENHTSSWFQEALPGGFAQVRRVVGEENVARHDGSYPQCEGLLWSFAVLNEQGLREVHERRQLQLPSGDKKVVLCGEAWRVEGRKRVMPVSNADMHAREGVGEFLSVFPLGQNTSMKEIGNCWANSNAFTSTAFILARFPICNRVIQGRCVAEKESWMTFVNWMLVVICGLQKL